MVLSPVPELDYQRFLQYGKIYGVYVMSIPWIYISGL
jgi:hypothetical protein